MYMNTYIQVDLILRILTFYSGHVFKAFVGLALVGKDIVFRLIIEYSSFKGSWSLGNRSIFIWGFLKDDIFAHIWS
jgi:hypothetical protein